MDESTKFVLGVRGVRFGWCRNSVHVRLVGVRIGSLNVPVRVYGRDVAAVGAYCDG